MLRSCRETSAINDALGDISPHRRLEVGVTQEQLADDAELHRTLRRVTVRGR
jgi:hypothetical protein